MNFVPTSILFKYSFFSISDRWSYGVVLYEIFTIGKINLNTRSTFMCSQIWEKCKIPEGSLNGSRGRNHVIVWCISRKREKEPKQTKNKPRRLFFMNRHSLCSIANAQMISLIVIVYSLITNDYTLRLGTTYCYFFVNTSSWVSLFSLKSIRRLLKQSDYS